MDHNDNSPRSIHQLVETIIEKGSMSKDEHQELNLSACRGQKQPEDAQAIHTLTSMINEGKVSVN